MTWRHRILLLSVSAALLAITVPAMSADDTRPPIDREEHETVKTATFALG